MKITPNMVTPVARVMIKKDICEVVMKEVILLGRYLGVAYLIDGVQAGFVAKHDVDVVSLAGDGKELKVTIKEEDSFITFVFEVGSEVKLIKVAVAADEKGKAGLPIRGLNKLYFREEENGVIQMPVSEFRGNVGKLCYIQDIRELNKAQITSVSDVYLYTGFMGVRMWYTPSEEETINRDFVLRFNILNSEPELVLEWSASDLERLYEFIRING